MYLNDEVILEDSDVVFAVFAGLVRAIKSTLAVSSIAEAVSSRPPYCTWVLMFPIGIQRVAKPSNGRNLMVIGCFINRSDSERLAKISGVSCTSCYMKYYPYTVVLK